jgi:hypothetical protein
VKISWAAKLRELFVLDQNLIGQDDPARSSYQRLAIPHTFQPQLSLLEAAISAAGAFLRILFGSILFAVWGTYTFYAWSTIRNLFLRGSAMLGLFLLFAVSFAFLLLLISALVRKCLPRSRKL